MSGIQGLHDHRPLPAPTRHAASPDNPYGLVNGGGHLVDEGLRALALVAGAALATGARRYASSRISANGC